MTNHKNISVTAVVYNEAHRIEHFLKSFSWSNEIIIIDKSSTDGTREIALKYTDKVFTTPYSDAGNAETRLALSHVSNEWVLLMTASDIIHPNLVEQLLTLINDESFHLDSISLPYCTYVLGIFDPKHSPWRFTNRTLMAKKTAIRTTDSVHRETVIDSKNVYRFPENYTECIYHLTHENVDVFLERHIRYTRMEAVDVSGDTLALKKAFQEITHALKYVLWRQKTWRAGWDGIALGLAYLTYSIFKFLFVWEKFRGKGSQEYDRIRKNINDLWAQGPRS